MHFGRPMRVLYAVHCGDNPLYEGKFLLNGRYATYGQHSFVLDLVRALVSEGVRVDLTIDVPERFPLVAPLSDVSEIVPFSNALTAGSIYDAVVLDEPDARSPFLEVAALRVLVIHNARKQFDARVVDASDVILCMSRSSVRRQSSYVCAEKILLLEQGVDLSRFQSLERPESPTGKFRVLVYSRIDDSKLSTMTRMVEILARKDVELTVLGDGAGFWPLVDEFGSLCVFMHFIPCQSMHRFLPDFDLAVSSGRGVMESLAAGRPAICAGLGYGGLVTPENVQRLQEYNMTGYGLPVHPGRVSEDLRRAHELEPDACRSMARQHFDVRRMARGLIFHIKSKGARKA